MFYVTTKMLSGNTGFYCGAASHDYLGSVPFSIYRDLAKSYATREAAELAKRGLPLCYHGSPSVQIIEEAGR